MIDNVDKVLEENYLVSLENMKSILLAGEGTDKANKSQLTICCRWKDNEVSDNSFGIVEIPQVQIRIVCAPIIALISLPPI